MATISFSGVRCVGGGPAIGKQVGEGVGGKCGQKREHFAKIDPGIEPVPTASLGEAEQDGGGHAAGVGAEEEPAFASDRDAAQGALACRRCESPSTAGHGHPSVSRAAPAPQRSRRANHSGSSAPVGRHAGPGCLRAGAAASDRDTC
jgi:hypothetical protein